ncbi:MAG: type I glyceraldehyde-3-phosphate dehydrogenase [Holosporaceae bacterium]|nr:type I glyceraldehyde-3-phosphate dehydrogenase [Holosporaceae bacterium]
MTKKSTKIAINGFGRIGRLVLRAFFESKRNYDFEIVAVNDLLNIDAVVHLLKYDSIHGPFLHSVEKISETLFSVDGKRITYTLEKFPAHLPWSEFGIDLVLECSGVFKSRTACLEHINAGAKKVLISCPVSDADRTIVHGINNDTLDKINDVIISNASCTTNCLAPLVKAIHEGVGIASGFATTVHSYTGDQRLIDAGHSDLRRARSAAFNMIPTSTGATKTIEKIFPELKGKLSGLSIRVPTSNVSVVDFTFQTLRKTTANELNDIIICYGKNILKGILGYTSENLVSSDFNHNPLSAIVDMPLTSVIAGNMGHMVAWYDNEWGFSNRMLDVSRLLLN